MAFTRVCSVCLSERLNYGLLFKRSWPQVLKSLFPDLVIYNRANKIN